jgi:hypothetical protein
MDASPWSMSCSYTMGDHVLAMCKVTTGGCLSNKTMLFQCKMDCDSQDPGTLVDQTKWGIANQCNQT